METFREVLFVLIAIPFYLCLYFLPSIVGRHKPYIKKLFLLNLLTGWTFVGWVASIIWATRKPAASGMSEAYISANNILLLEQLSRLNKEGIITDEEFSSKKAQLLDQTTPERKPINIKLNKRINVAVACILALGFSIIIYGVISPFLTSSKSTVENYLSSVQSKTPNNFFQIAPPFSIYASNYENRLPIIANYIVEDEQSVDSLSSYSEEYFAVNGTIMGDETSGSVVFLVRKRFLDFEITDSYNFLNTGSNQIVFPETMPDSKRIELVQNSTKLVTIVSSSCQILNNAAQGSAQIKNNFSLPLKDVCIQVQYTNNKQQIIKTEVVKTNDRIKPGQTCTISWFTSNCKDCVGTNLKSLTP